MKEVDVISSEREFFGFWNKTKNSLSKNIKTKFHNYHHLKIGHIAKFFP